MTPAMVPPAMYPVESSTPGLISDSSSLAGVSRDLRLDRSTKYRTSPPTKIGVEEESGR